jgi:hypothetical protein
MHPALRSSLAVIAIIACVGCETHDRRIYTIRRDKNLHVPNPWAPSTTKAADEATASLGLPPDGGPSPDGATAPALPAPPPIPPPNPTLVPGQ